MKLQESLSSLKRRLREEARKERPPRLLLMRRKRLVGIRQKTVVEKLLQTWKREKNPQRRKRRSQPIRLLRPRRGGLGQPAVRVEPLPTPSMEEEEEEEDAPRRRGGRKRKSYKEIS